MADNGGSLPPHLLNFKQTYESFLKKQIHLPVIGTLTPRTKKKLSTLPAPTFVEQEAAEKKLKEIKRVDAKQAYNTIQAVADANRAERHLHGDVSKPANERLSVDSRKDAVHDVELDVTSTEYYASVERRRIRQDAQRRTMMEAIARNKGYNKIVHTDLSKTAPILFDSVVESSCNSLSRSNSGILLKPIGDKLRFNKSSDTGQRGNELKACSTIAGPIQAIREVNRDISDSVSIDKAIVATKIVTNINKTVLDARMHERVAKRMDADYSAFLEHLKSSMLDDYGLNVDEVFNRKRKYGKACYTLIYYVSTYKLKNAFTWLKLKVKHINQLRKVKAAMTICFFAKKFLHFVHERAIRQNREAQAEALRLAVQRHQDRMNLAGSMVIGLVRFKNIKNRLRKRKAATLIQSRVRAIMARAYVQHIREYNYKLFCCARSIQCAYRQRLAYRKAILFAKLRYVDEWMHNIDAEAQKKQLRLRQLGAVRQIIAAYRQHRLRTFLRRLVFWHKMELVMGVQRRFRGYMQRKKYKKMLLEAKRRELKKNQLATKIQRQARRYICVKNYSIYLEEKKRAKEIRFEQKKQRLEQLKLQPPRAKTKTFKEKIQDHFTLKYVEDGRHATKLQKLFRGFWARKRASMMRIRQQTKKYELRVTRRRDSAVVIQRHWRGRWCRLAMKKSKQIAMVIRIQCFWRVILAKAICDHKRGSLRALRMVSHNMHRFLMRFKARRIRHQQIKFGSVVTVIQRLALKYIGKVRLLHMKHDARATAEQREYGQGKTVNTLCAVQLRLIAESMTQEIGKKYPTISGVECPMQGPMQALFIAAVGGRARTDTHALMTNKLDSKNFSKFCSRLGNFVSQEGPAGSDVVPHAKKFAQNKDKSPAVLIDAIANDRFVTKKGVHAISQTDLDLIFSETKEDSTEGPNLSFKEFIRCLDILANIYFHIPSATPAKKQDRKPKSKPKSVKSSKDTEAAAAAATAQVNRAKSPTNHSMRATSPPLELPIGAIATKPQQRFHDSLNLLAPLSLICGETPHYGLLLALQLMSVYRYEKWMSGVNTYLDNEACRRLGVFVVRMQCMVRRRSARKRRDELIEERRQVMLQLEYEKRIIRVQSVLRRFMGMRRCCRIAQIFLIKYVTYNGQSYYYNPSTRVSTWTKPRVLRQFDCTTIPLPPTGLEVMVKCSNCRRDGQTTCLQCEDTYCHECFMSLHCKGNRRLHHSKPIPKCSYCKFQVATKNCLTCMLRKPTGGSAASYMKPSDRGKYCDPCFCHYHDQNEIELARDWERKAALNDFLANTREAYIVKQFIHQRLRTDHRFEHIVQTCEECQWRCASWRCEDCNQIYCHKCLVGLHSIEGPFQAHKAESLPFFTREMHVSYQHDLEEQQMAHKLSHYQRSSREKDEARLLTAVQRIQKWWRGRYYARAGKAYLKKERKRLRFAWRLRKKEDKELRVGWTYRIRDYFGWNPQFSSDTKEEAVLKSLPMQKRPLARELILRNIEDWGWFRISSREPQKGIPRTGFDVGSISELIDQAHNGGLRLPGKIILQGGVGKHRTSKPLSAFLSDNQLLRVRDQLYLIKEISDDYLTLDRPWFFGDCPNGEIMYLMPNDKESVEGKSNRRRHQMQLFKLNNPITQSAISLYIWTLRVRARYALRMAVTAKRAGSLEDAIDWRDYGNHFNAMATHLMQYKKPRKDEKKRSAGLSASRRSAKISKNEEAANTSEESKKDEAMDRPRPQPSGMAPSLIKVADDEESVGKSITIAKAKYEAEMALPMHLRFGRQPGVEWVATPEEQLARRELEANMPKSELALQASLWEERINPTSGAVYYVHLETFERSETVPSSVQMKRDLDEESLRAKAKVDEAKAKMADLEKKSTKMTGAKKRY